MVRLDAPELIEHRRLALVQAHVAPLEYWRGGLLADGKFVPHFDLADGGINASLLLLLETPGPGTEQTRFVSRDDPSGTGRNLRRYHDEAGIDRRDIFLWNAVPSIMLSTRARNRALRKAEIDAGLATLPRLFARLPTLQVCLLSDGWPGRLGKSCRHMIRRSQS